MTGVAVSDQNVDQLSLSWVPSGDDRGVDYYEVFLNGYLVGRVTSTRAVVPWLNDSATEFLLTVRAIDTSGNAGPESDGIPVTRPEPEPSPSPSDGDPPSGPPTAPIAPEPTGTP